MHFGRRLMFSLFGCVAIVSSVFAIYQAEAEMHALRDEAQRQAQVLAESLQQPLVQALESGYPGDPQVVVDQFTSHPRMAGVAVYDANGRQLAITPALESRAAGALHAVAAALESGRGHGEFLRLAGHWRAMAVRQIFLGHVDERVEALDRLPATPAA